jgi:hypothetical protein
MGVNSHLCIKLFGNPSLKSYKPRTNEWMNCSSYFEQWVE